MPKTRVQKAESIERLISALKSGKAAAFADYRGMNVEAVATLRKNLRAEGVDYIVAKKTLLSRAAKEAGYDIDFTKLEGMLGVAIAQEDEMAPAKIIGDASKEQPIKLVGGIFEGQVVDREYIMRLSKLPSREGLLTQLLYVMNGPVGSFVRLLNAYKEKMEAGEPAPVAPEEVKEEAPVEAPSEEKETPAPEGTEEGKEEPKEEKKD